VPRAIRQYSEHRHLTIVDLAQASTPLPGNTNRTIALLDEAAFVNDQRTGRLAAEQAIGIAGDLLDYRLMPPRRIADEVLELLLAAILNHCGHRCENGLVRPRQAMQVALRHCRIVVPVRAKERAVALDEMYQGNRNLLDQRFAQRSPAHTVTRRIAAPTSPLQAQDARSSIDSTDDSDVKSQFDDYQPGDCSVAVLPHAPGMAGSMARSNGHDTKPGNIRKCRCDKRDFVKLMNPIHSGMQL
jgi:hypothetical protein